MAMRLRRALDVYSDKRRWRGLQRRGMGLVYSWKRAAQAYSDLYQKIAMVRQS